MVTLVNRNEYYRVINQVISYWPSHRPSIGSRGQVSEVTGTAGRGPVTGRIRNRVINDIFINLYIYSCFPNFLYIAIFAMIIYIPCVFKI